MYKTEIRQQEIDVFKVPKKILYNGDTIPSIGLGTFGSDRFSGEEIASAVKGAFESGYRHFDCASVYGNQHLIGKFLKEILRENKVKREELWITSKIWNDCHAEEKVLSSLEQTLREYKEEHGLPVLLRTDIEPIVGFVLGKNRVHPIHSYEVAYVINDKGQTLERIYGQYNKH